MVVAQGLYPALEFTDLVLLNDLSSAETSMTTESDCARNLSRAACDLGSEVLRIDMHLLLGSCGSERSRRSKRPEIGHIDM